MSTIGITGGTGFIGKHLIDTLVNNKHEVIVFSRNASKRKNDGLVTYAHWDAEKKECDKNALARLDAAIHLAGAGIADKRWTEKRKQEIVESRVEGTRFFVSQLKAYAPRCKTFIAASATGYYGPDKIVPIYFAEDASPYNDFLSRTCVKWEAESKQAEETMRTVIFRFGIVLGKEGGAFPQFAKPMSFGIKAILGKGKQILSWIEVGDLARMILFAIENDQMNGIYNAVTPKPVSNKKLVEAIAKEKGGAKISIKVPVFVLKMMLGQMSEEVLKSCMVSAKKISATGFTFNYPSIDVAVKAILND